MRNIMFTVMFLALAAAGYAADEHTIELKDGGRVVVQKDGTMAHIDAAGNRLKMRDGVVMEAKDGSQVMMKNNAIWKTITEHGTLKPGH